MIAGVSVITLLLVLVAGIGAGFVGYAVGASSLISYPALLAFGIPPVLSGLALQWALIPLAAYWSESLIRR